MITSSRITSYNVCYTKLLREAINAFLGTTSAKALDPATIDMSIPEKYRSNVVSLMTDIEQLRVEPDQLAKVVIDEQSGIIVIGQNVRIDDVAIAQGNLTRNNFV